MVLDFNPPPSPSLHFVEQMNATLDEGLLAHVREGQMRAYLGASILGEPCLRRLQYIYTRAPQTRTPSAKHQRIFDTGHAFEALAISWMKHGGFDLRTRDNQGCQFNFTAADGKIKGHIDGILMGGNPTLKYPCLWECKSMNSRNWKDCVKRGVAISKPLYYAQIQLYMAYMNLHENPTLFMAVNKDTSELFFEAVPYDGACAQYHSDRAVQVIKATEANETLPRITRDPAYFECKMCPYATKCWEDQS